MNYPKTKINSSEKHYLNLKLIFETIILNFFLTKPDFH